MKTKHLLLVALLGICLMLWSTIDTSSVPAPAPAVASNKPGALNITGLSYSNYSGDRLVSRLQARELAVAPRKMGAFRIKSVNELILKEMDFLRDIEIAPDFTEADRDDQASQIASGLKNLIDTKGMGRITQVVVEGLRLDLQKSGQAHLEVKARGGVFDLKKKELRMDDVVLEGVEGRRLTSQLVLWDEPAQLFRIPEGYVLSEKGQERRAKGALVDMNLKVIPLQAKNGD